MTDAEIEQAYLAARAAGDEQAMTVIGAVLKRRRAPTLASGAKSFGSGVVKTLGSVLANAGVSEAGPQMLPIDQQAAARQAQEEAAKQASMNLGGGYQPQNRQDRYLKAAGEGAVPMPGPMPLVGAVTGALGGAGAEYAREQDLGPVAETAAFMAPSLAYGFAKSMAPGTAYRDVRRVLESTTPQELAETRRVLGDARTRGVDLMPFQAAPEQSALRNFGESVALNPDAAQIQQALRSQMGQTGQGWVAQRMDPKFAPLNQRPVSPRLAERIARAVGNVENQRVLNPAGSDAAAVQKAIPYFGARQPGDIQAYIAKLQADLKTVPAGSPEYKAIVAKLMDPNLKAPEVFKPTVSNVGQVISAAQDFSPKSQAFMGHRAGTLTAIKEAIAKKLGHVPGYRSVMEDYEKTKTVAERVAAGQRLRGEHVKPALEHEVRSSLGAAVPYAVATNPAWALVPPIRRMLSRKVAEELDNALASRDLEALNRLAGRNPQIEAAVPVLAQIIRGDSALPDLQLRDISNLLPNGGQ